MQHLTRLFIFAFFFVQPFVTSARGEPIDEIVRAEMLRQHIPGLSLAIVKDGRVIKEKGYGLANLEHAVPVRPQTVFQTGSVGKMFTAAITLLLVQDGKLELDAPVSNYLPNAPKTWAGITVRHLLTHTAGLEPIDKAIDLRKDYTEDALLQSAYALPLMFAPGEKWAYGSLGYQVLGILCSKVGGKFYGEQLRERVFQPAGMSQTRIVSERDIVVRRAAGYDRDGGVFKNQTWVAPSLNTTADGSLYSTAQDLARWSIALDGDKVLKRAQKTASWTPARLTDGSGTDYGFGWTLHALGGRPVARHQGAWQGFTSQLLRLQNDRLTVVVLTNRSGARPDVIAEKVAAYFVPAVSPRHAELAMSKALGSKPLYLRGAMNEWGTEDAFQQVETGVFEARVRLGVGAHEFKLASADWAAMDFGSPFEQPTVLLNKSKLVEPKGGNLSVQVDKEGTYVFRLDARRRDGLRLVFKPSEAG